MTEHQQAEVKRLGRLMAVALHNLSLGLVPERADQAREARELVKQWDDLINHIRASEKAWEEVFGNKPKF